MFGETAQRKQKAVHVYTCKQAHEVCVYEQVYAAPIQTQHKTDIAELRISAQI